MVATETNAFLTWFQTWYSVPYVIAQVVFWLGLAVAAVMIALQYKRFVDFKTGKPVVEKSKPEAAKADVTESASSVSIEEFVD